MVHPERATDPALRRRRNRSNGTVRKLGSTEVMLMVSKDRLWKRIELAVDSPRLLQVIEVEIRSAPSLDNEERAMMLGRGVDVLERHPPG